MNYDEFLPTRLSQLRIKKNVSARDMSLSLGQANNYINSIENGKSLPSMRTFFYICEYLGITPEEFFATDTKDPVRLRELVDEIKKLDESAMESLLVIARQMNRNI